MRGELPEDSRPQPLVLWPTFYHMALLQSYAGARAEVAQEVSAAGFPAPARRRPISASLCWKVRRRLIS